MNNESVSAARGEASAPQESAAGERRVERLTAQLGLLQHRKSTKCMNAALLYCVQHPEGTQLITKILYPIIAKKFGTTSSAVERNIRHAIATVQKAETALCYRIFPQVSERRISNVEFLSVAAEYLTSTGRGN